MRHLVLSICLWNICLFSVDKSFAQCKGWEKTCNEDKCGDVSIVLGSNDENVFCDGQEVFLEINLAESSSFDFFVFYWCDGEIDTISNTELSVTNKATHLYSLSSEELCETEKDDFSVTVKGIHLCDNTFSCVTVSSSLSVIHPPVANFESEPEVCTGYEIAFINSSCNSSSYLWDFGDGNTSTNANPSHIYANTKAIYDVCLTVSNECGDDTKCKRVKVVSEPLAEFISNSPVIGCTTPYIVSFTNQTDIVYSNTQWTIIPDDTTKWMFTSPSINFDSQDIEVIFKTTGEYEIILTATNACGKNEKTILINILDQPTINIDPILNQCETSFNYNPLFSGSEGLENIRWEFPGGSPASFNGANPGIISYNGAGTYTVVLSANNVCGGIKDSTSFIIIDPDSATKFDPISVCLDGMVIDLDQEILEGDWSGDGVNTQDIFNPFAVGEGIFTISYKQYIEGCSIESELNITVLSPENVSAGLDQVLCKDDPSFNLVGTPLGGSWTFENETLTNLNVDPSVYDAGEYIFVYHFNDTNGCENSDEIVVIIDEVNVEIDTSITSFCNTLTPINLIVSPTGGVWTGNGITNGQFIPSDAGNGVHQLIYTYTNNNNCQASATLEVTVVETESIDAGIDQVFCKNDDIILLQAVEPLTGTWSGNGVIGTSFNPANANIGENIITYTVGTGSCQLIDTKIFTVYPLPNIIIPNSQSVCLNEDPLKLQVNELGGYWRGEGITDSINGIFTPFEVGFYQVDYIYQDPETGCVQNISTTVEVEGIPPFNFRVDSIACINQILQFNINGGIGMSCKWNFGDGLISNDCYTNHTYENFGYHKISLDVTTPLGCNDSVTQDILITQAPKAMFRHDVLSNNFVCTPLSITLTNESNTYEASTNTIWNFGNGDSLIVRSDSVIYFVERGDIDVINNDVKYTYTGNYIVSDTTFYIKMRVENQCGTDIYIDSIKVAPTPQVRYGIDVDDICSGTPLQFNNLTIGKPETLFWNFGDGTTSTEFSPPPHTFYTEDQPTIYTISLIANNRCGTDTLTWDIKVRPNTVKAFFYRDITDGCMPLTVNFEDFSTEGTFINWDFGDGNIANTPNVTHNFDTAGVFTVTQSASNGCAYDTMTTNIIVSPAPIIDDIIVTSTPSCALTDISFNVETMSELSGYEWDFGNSDSSYTNRPVYSYDTAGLYTVTVKVYAADNGCPTSKEKVVEIIANPIADFETSKLDGCSPLDISFNNLTQNGTYYNWDFGDGNYSIEKEPDYKYISDIDTFFSITLVSTNQTACIDSIQKNVQVYGQPRSYFEIKENDLCDIPATIEIINLSEGAIDYVWETSDGQISNLKKPVFSFNDIDVYEVGLTTHNIFGCHDYFMERVFIHPKPKADFYVPKTNGCEPLSILFENNTLNATSYFWDFGDNTYSNEMSPIKVYEEAGLYKIQLIAQYQEFCFDTSLISTIEIYPSPWADFEIEELIADIPNGTIQFTSMSQDVANYHWDFGDGDTATVPNPIHRYLTNGPKLVTLTVDNGEDCVYNVTKEIRYKFMSGLHVPNAFIPEAGPPEIRYFQPKGIGISEYSIEIYSSWGELIWESNQLENGVPSEKWDGYFNGKLMPQGSYIWKVNAIFEDGSVWKGKEYDNGTTSNIGTVTLLR